MRIFMIIVAVMVLAACGKEGKEQTIPAVEKVNPTKKEHVMIESSTQTDVAQVNIDKEGKETSADTNTVALTPVKAPAIEQKTVKPNPAKAEEMKPVNTTVAKKTPEAAQVTTPTGKKVVAPLVQGKAPIKSEPNPAPSNILFKPEPVMDIAKANTLTKKCKSCHATNKDKVGPSWKKIQAAYGSIHALTTVLESGFAVENRKVLVLDTKWKKKAKTMTSQYKTLIKKQVEKGVFTYKELAEAMFAK